MKKIIIFCCSLYLILILDGNAQIARQSGLLKIKALKVNFISKELGLTPEKAKLFWPIFEDFEKEKHEIKHQKLSSFKKQIKTSGGIESLSDEKARELLGYFIEIDEKINKLNKEYFTKLESILTPKQLLKLRFTETNFNRLILRQFYKNKGRRKR